MLMVVGAGCLQLEAERESSAHLGGGFKVGISEHDNLTVLWVNRLGCGLDRCGAASLVTSLCVVWCHVRGVDQHTVCVERDGAASTRTRANSERASSLRAPLNS